MALFSCTMYFFFFITKLLRMKGCSFHQNKKIAETDTSNILKSLKNAGANYALLNAYKRA